MRPKQQLLQAKRARTHATTANNHEECDKQSSDDWDLTGYRREATLIQKRSSVALGSREDVPTPQKGIAGPLEHSRLGLVGWIAYWSLGNCALAVKAAAKQREKRVAEWVAKALPLAKSGVWVCVQVRAQWSTEEDVFMRPGHHCLCEFGDAGNGTSCVKQFNLEHRKWEDYRGTRFYNKDCALVIRLCSRQKKKSRGGFLRHPRMMRLKTLFRALLDHHDRGIILYLENESFPRKTLFLPFFCVSFLHGI